MTLVEERPIADVIPGEDLVVPERLVCAPAAGVFRPAAADTITSEGEIIYGGQVVGTVAGPRTSVDVVSPFTGFFMGMLAHAGERVRAEQPVLWIRVTDPVSVAAAQSGARGHRDRSAPMSTGDVCAPFSIAGWGAAVPPTVVTNADLEARLDTTDAWITARSGIRERRLASDGETTAGLAIRAATEAMQRASIGVADVDLVIVATSTPEQPMPPTAPLVAAGLVGDVDHLIDHGPATVDVNGACAGFPYALAAAASLLNVGIVHTALVVAAETMSRIVNPRDRTTAVLFGDGAAALVLLGGSVAAPGGVSGDGATRSAFSSNGVARTTCGGLLAGDLISDPGGVDLLTVAAGGAARPASADTIAAGDHFMRMDGPEVFRRAVRAVVASVERTLCDAGLAPDDVDVFVPHQANARIVDAVCSRTGIAPERAAGNIERYGNTSAASIPLVLAELADTGRLRDGDLVLTTGFGAGLTVGTVLFRWSTT